MGNHLFLPSSYIPASEIDTDLLPRLHRPIISGAPPFIHPHAPARTLEAPLGPPLPPLPPLPNPAHSTYPLEFLFSLPSRGCPSPVPLVAHPRWQGSPSPGTRQAVKIQKWSPSAAANFPGNSALPNRLQPRPLSMVLYDLVPDDLFNSCLLFSFLSLSCRTKVNSLHFSKLHAILEGEKKKTLTILNTLICLDSFCL